MSFGLMLVDIQYVGSAQEVEHYRPAHRAFLDIWYQKGVLLVSGPKASGTGGILIAKGSSQEIAQMVAQDPFTLHHVAKSTITEFQAVKHAPCLESFLK